MKNAPKIAAVLCAALFACAGAASSVAQTVPGWPDYLAMGAIGGPNDTPQSTGGSDDFGGKAVDVVFKYAGINGDGDPGVIDPPMNALRMTEDLTYLSGINGRAMRVAIVEYTAQMSNGPSTVDFTNTSSPAGNGATYMMARHLISLGADAMALNDKPVVYNSTNYYGTLILNPDLLGAIQQQSYLSSVNTALGLNPVNTAVDQALCFLTTSRSYSGYNSTTYNGTPVSILEQLIAANYPKWQISDPSDAYWGTAINNQNGGVYSQVGTWFNSCVSSPSYNHTTYPRPNFANTLEGWVQANNWLIRTFSPQGHVTFGWQDNMWAVNSGYWVHADLTDNQIATTYSTPLSDWLQTNAPSSIETGALGASYKPDYFVFDRYETDDSDTVRGGVQSATFYNARSWDNYVKAVGQVSANFDNIPMMLWQIPGAHIANSAEANPEHLLGGNANQYVFSTAPVYFFGDSNLTAGLANMKAGGNVADPSIAGGDYRLCAAYPSYGCSNTTTYKQWLLTDSFNWSQDNGKREMAVANNVFAILWGGGSTTNVIKNFNNADDHGWLAGKIATYYLHPTPVGAPVTPAPTISTVSPSSGPLAGGNTVTITGTNLTGASAVTFGVNAGSSIVVNGGGTSLIVTAPGHAAGQVDVAVTTTGGTATKTNGYTYTAQPVVTAVSPNSGPIAGNTTVTITGANLSDTTAVKFGTAAATLTNITATSITVESPQHAAGAVDVTVTTPDGTSAVVAADKFTYTAPPPAVTQVLPSAGTTAGGTQLTITGTNFTGVTGVTFSGVAGTNIQFVSDTEIKVRTPAHAQGGAAVRVTTNDGASNSATDGLYTYLGPATITSITPAGGPIAGGTAITIKGTNYDSAFEVQIGGTSSLFHMVNSTTITATTPQHLGSPGAVDVRVGTAAGAVTKTHAFTYYARPTITAINPNQGPAKGGAQVSIVGTNLTGATGVKFGGTAAKSFSASNSTHATATAPAHGAGAVSVTLTTPGGTSATAAGNKFTYTATPVLTTIAKFVGGKNDGAKPVGGLVADSSGALYGTTSQGGKKGLGTLFKLKPSGDKFTKTILHHFDGVDGATPFAGLVIDKDKNLYGVTTAGGNKNKGVIFKYAASTKKVTVLHNFQGTAVDGGVPYATLARDAKGVLYGATTTGGSKGKGTAFTFKAPSTFKVTHHFTGGNDGDNPQGAMLLDSSKNVYGTTLEGGKSKNGIVFKIAPNGSRTVLHTFANGNDGREPRGGLYKKNSMLIGTASKGGTANKGAIFEIKPPSTAASLLFSFTGATGANPYAGVIGDGATILYGTTFNGGAHNKGTVFKLLPPANDQTAWSQSVMASFKGGSKEGASPAAPLLLGKHKTLYGTTDGGGSSACAGGCGTVFKVVY